MRARFSCIGLFVLCAFVLTGLLSAQINTCNARGVVSDQNQNPVAGAAVEFQAIELGIKFVLHTNKKGEYFQLGVKPGFYNISVSAQGYGTYQMSTYLEMGSDFTNHVGNTNNDNVHNFVLPPAGKNIDDRAAATSNIRVFGNLGPTQDTRQEREAKRQRELQKENADIQKRVAKVKGLNEKLLMASSAGKAGDWDQAVAFAQQATQMAPDIDLTWDVLGDSYMGKQQPEEAERANRKANEMHTNIAGYHNNLARARSQRNDLEHAVPEFAAAIKLDPFNASRYYYNMAAAFTRAHDADRAVKAWDEVIRLDPTKSDAYYWKAFNLNAQDHPASTAITEALKQYLEREPDGQYADAAKEMLQQVSR